MTNVGSYLLSAAQDRAAQDITPKDAAPRLLKVIAEKRGCSQAELGAATGYTEPVINSAIGLLFDSGMIEGSPDRYALTPMGEKTHLLVAS